MGSTRMFVGMIAGAALLGSPAVAQTWPAHAITAISPIGAGNAVDALARVMFDPMSKDLGQPIIIENRPGGGVPASTPSAVVTRLYDEGRKALELPAVQNALTKLGYEPMQMTPAEFQSFFAKDLTKTVKLAKQVGIAPGE